MLKPISKEDKPKIIVMSVLVAGLAGTAVYQCTRGDERLPEAAALAAKTPPKEGAASASALPGAPAAAGRTLQAGLVRPAAFGTPVSGNVSETRIVGDDGAVYDLAMVGPPVGGKDPFMPFASAITVVAPPPPAAPTAPPAKPALPFTPPPNLAVGRLDSLLNKAGITSGITSGIPSSVSRGGGASISEVMNDGGGMMKPGGFSGPSAAAAVALPPPPPPTLIVTGIVVSVPQPGLPTAESVAVMRGAGGAGNSERRFVRAGDLVGNGFVVAHVWRDSVVIKSTTKGDNRRIVLHLGETLTAAGMALPVQTPTNAPAGETMGKDAPKNADKNTNDKNTVVAPVLNEMASANTASAAAGPASQLGEFRAN